MIETQTMRKFQGVKQMTLLRYVLTVAAALLLGAASASAQGYPNKPITVIVPFAPTTGLRKIALGSCAIWLLLVTV